MASITARHAIFTVKIWKFKKTFLGKRHSPYGCEECRKVFGN